METMLLFPGRRIYLDAPLHFALQHWATKTQNTILGLWEIMRRVVTQQKMPSSLAHHTPRRTSVFGLLPAADVDPAYTQLRLGSAPRWDPGGPTSSCSAGLSCFQAAWNVKTSILSRCAPPDHNPTRNRSSTSSKRRSQQSHLFLQFQSTKTSSSSSLKNPNPRSDTPPTSLQPLSQPQP
jgi:hypothetical protein